MGVRGLQSYILAKCPDSLIPVELTANTDKKKRLIVVEGWSCLRSVYGPHMDFICGGQWQEFRASIRRFVNTFQQANCELVVFFSGGIEDAMRAEWVRKKSQNGDTVNMVMQGLRQRGYAPDRKHFLPNETHPQVFRQVLLNCHVKVISTPNSTDKNMVEYAHNNNAYGILANDSDFIMMNAPRYLSLHHLRISGSTISTGIIDREKISDCLGLPLPLFPLLSCLLGNDVVNYEMLEEFHQRLLKDAEEEGSDKKKDDKEGVLLVGAVIEFLNNLDADIKTDISANISHILDQVFPEKTEELETLFLSGLDQYQESTPKPAESPPLTVVTVNVVEKEKTKVKVTEDTEEKSEEDSDEVDPGVQEITEMIGETNIVDDDDEEPAFKEEEVDVEVCEEDAEINIEENEKEDGSPKLITVPAITSKVLGSAAAAHASGTLNSHLYPLMCSGTFSLAPLFEDNKDKDTLSSALLYRTARQRIYGLIFGIGRGWVKSDAKRQRSTKIDTQRQVTVREFVVNGSKKNLVDGEEVAAIPVHAPNAKQPPRKPTPHIDRLWIGMSAKIQELRRSTLLAIMNCNIPSFFSPNVIANEYLLVCIVLRYILVTGSKVLREYEVDAFLATALSPQLHFGPSHLYKVTPGRLTSRGCSIAHVFVRGVETLLLANDACNYPINRRFCFLGNFFDGKLFQLKLGQCRAGLSLLDICDGDLGAVDYFRHLRCIVTEELPRSVFASPAMGPMPPPRGAPGRGGHHMPPGSRPPHDVMRMKFNEPRHHFNNNSGNNRGMYRSYNNSPRSQYRPPSYGPPPFAPSAAPYNHPTGPYHQPLPQGGYNQGTQPPRNQHYQQQKQFNNRRYPAEQSDSYQDSNYNTGYQHRKDDSYNHHNNTNNMNGNYAPYKQQPPTEGGAPVNGAFYHRGGDQHFVPGGENLQTRYAFNKGGAGVANFKDNDPYGKRNVPDRSDTKQWINFLGN